MSVLNRRIRAAFTGDVQGLVGKGDSRCDRLSRSINLRICDHYTKYRARLETRRPLKLAVLVSTERIIVCEYPVKRTTAQVVHGLFYGE